ncbi:Mg2+ and Co2+ transporter CorA [Pseudochelatococcus lubricantis]|uniref:Mg2+ and Co2+ transporter CorA n=1 Tax=Pseudochelatococcus lubricantis TaxID=1538102 RepID=A0ABX0UUP3_9HYPH|nr:CorA family divalent cation transporter [Pseudochelatococcus lubricantis]NIJ56686.1 Mg2+ and Co2+ transporter CorA [Pseudochelatococcus lubricantis]
MQQTPLATIISDTRDTMWLCRFDGNGQAHWDGIREEDPPALALDTLLCPADEDGTRGFVWIHVDLVDTRARNWIGGLPFVPEPLRQRFITSTGRRSVACQDGVLNFSLPDSALNFDTPTDEMTFLQCLVGADFIITGRRRKVAAVAEVVAATDKGQHFATPVILLGALVGQITQRLEAASAAASDELDDIEDHVLSERMKANTTQLLGPLRRAMARVHRQTLILRQTVFQVECAETAMPPDDRRRALHVYVERLDVLDHDTVSEQGRAKILQDEISTRIANESNRSLYIVTMMTTFFMPPALIAGIFGMNVANLPLTETRGGFWWSVLLLLLSIAGTYYILRRFVGSR